MGSARGLYGRDVVQCGKGQTLGPNFTRRLCLLINIRLGSQNTANGGKLLGPIGNKIYYTTWLYQQRDCDIEAG